ncbi:MAG: hypothetical protein U5O39_04470 [Gammaproteobacteria bacterium]|nr:hypothetical protein [Gammaproteobacteria bacterium]
MIDVMPKGDGTFRVDVSNGSTTSLTSAVPAGYAAELSGGDATDTDLVERSFEFLLEREPASSILRSFELPVIARYFPEYEDTMKSLYGSR